MISRASCLPHQARRSPTCLLHVAVVAGQVVLLADEGSVGHDVQLVSRVELLLADVAFEAVEVEDAVLGLAD